MTPGLRKVETCNIRPFQCAFYPTLGARHAKGYYTTGQDDPEGWNHAFASVEFIELAARAEGWVSPAEVADLRARVEDLERDNERLADEVRDLNKDFEAIDMLASRGFTARRKPGRKAQNQEAA